MALTADTPGIWVVKTRFTTAIIESATTRCVAELGWKPSSENQLPKLMEPPVGTALRLGNGGMPPS